MSNSNRPAALSAAAFARNNAGGGAAIKSPTKSPTRVPAAAVLLRTSVDDVSYRQADSTRSMDQAQTADAAPSHHAAGDTAPSAERQSKYINLLSAVYSQPAGAKPRSPAAVAAAGGRQQLPGGCAPLAPPEPPAAPPLRSSASPKGPAGKGANTTTTPILRRSARSSILDSSQGASMIPASPEAAAAVSSSNSSGYARPVLSGAGPSSSSKLMTGVPRAGSPVSRLRSSAGSAGVPSRPVPARECASPIRRSAPAAQQQQPKAQYAFGTRIEPPAAIKRRPSPTRVGPPAAAAAAVASPGSVAAGDRMGRLRAAASPQRVPAAGRVSAAGAGSPAAGYRSASAPRMSSADKAQSRFTQHAVTAAAAQRSKTPNPAQRAAAAAAAAAASSSGAAAARRLRHSSHSTASESKHVARMRASDSAAGPQHSRLPGFSSTSMGLRSPTKGPAAAHLQGSPILRGAGSRSVLAAPAPAAAAGARLGSASKGIPGAPGARVKPPGVRSMDRVGLTLPGAAGRGGASASSGSQDCAVMVPVIKDRYKDLFKHTPAATAVEEARAAAAAARRSPSPAAERSRPRSGAVPKLALGGLARQGSGGPPAAPWGPAQQQQQHAEAAGDVASPYLGRISGLAASPEVSSSSLHKAPADFSTPQGQRKPVVPLLALSTLTPVPKSRPVVAAAPGAAASPCTPLQAAGPVQDETPSLLVKSQPRTGSSSKGAADSRTGGQLEPPSPLLAPRNLSSGMQAEHSSSFSAAPAEAGVGAAEGCSAAPAAAAGRGFLAIPGLQLPDAAAGEGHFDSPPRHRRGERESPSSPADPGSQGALKLKANTLCSTAASSSSSVAAHSGSFGVPGRVPPAGISVPGRSGPPSASKAAAAAAVKTRQRVGGAAAAAGGSVLEGSAEAGKGRAGVPVRRSLPSGVPSPTAGTPASRQRLSLDATTPGSQFGRSTPLPSPSKKLGTPVPRLDLTPVLASMAAEQDGTPDAAPDSHSHQGMLLLEDAPRRRLELDGDADEDPHSQRQSSGKGKPGSGKGRVGSGKSHGLNSNSKKGPGSKGSQASAEPLPQESFYVYESVMPPEEQRTYEELRRVLLKAPGGSKHVANLQGIWGCYQDARRNTEAMAFRGHRLLDQVSTEYSSFKREAEVKLEELEQERDAAREELQLAMVAGSVPASALQLAAKDQELRELQHENTQLRQQVAEYEKAMHMASEYHAATQAAHQEQQVPVHARVIAGSATTSILTNQVVAQQYELQKVEKRMEDMKAALHLACGVLRQTNYMDEQSELRTHLDHDTLTVLDTIMATEEMEAVAMAQEQAAAAHMLQQGAAYQPASAPAEPAVHIEEVHSEGAASPASADCAGPAVAVAEQTSSEQAA